MKRRSIGRSGSVEVIRAQRRARRVHARRFVLLVTACTLVWSACTAGAVTAFHCGAGGPVMGLLGFFSALVCFNACAAWSAGGDKYGAWLEEARHDAAVRPRPALHAATPGSPAPVLRRTHFRCKRTTTLCDPDRGGRFLFAGAAGLLLAAYAGCVFVNLMTRLV